MKKFVFTLLLVFVCHLGYAQSINGLFNEFGSEKNADCVKVSSFMMSLGKMFAGHDEDAEIIRKIKSIKVLDLESCTASVKERFSKKVNRLSLKGYDELMRVNDEGEKVRVLMKTKKETIRELLFVCTGKEDCTLVQINGKFTKEDIDKLVNQETKKKHGRAEFKQQFLPYHRKLYRTAFRLTENPQEAEDMVQEAYLKLWNKRDELAGVLNTEAYCVTLVKNLCYDALRRSRPDEDGHAPEELNLPTDTNIAREVEQRDEVNQVRRLIGRLPEQQKRVILLRDVNDCSFEEIEQATGLNAINIRVLLSRARKKIREQYNAIMNYESK